MFNNNELTAQLYQYLMRLLKGGRNVSDLLLYLKIILAIIKGRYICNVLFNWLRSYAATDKKQVLMTFYLPKQRSIIYSLQQRLIPQETRGNLCP